MSKKNLTEEVTRLVGEHLGVPPEEIAPDDDLVDKHGMDSLDGVELVMMLEEEYDLEVTDAAAEAMTTVGAIVEHLRGHVDPELYAP
jgi:acyl carrier protein